MRNGAMLAVEDVNARGGIHGKRVVLHIKDDMGLADQAVVVDQELVNEGIVLGIGHLSSGPGLPGVKILLDAGIPVISPTMSTGILSGLDDGFFRVMPESVWQGRLLAQEMLERSSDEAKVSILLEENNMEYCEDVSQGFQEVWEAAGRRVTNILQYESGETVAFDEIAEDMLQHDADVYLIVTGGLDLAVFSQKIRKHMPDTLIASGMWGMSQDFLQNAGMAGEGVLFPHLYSMTSTVPAWTSFVDRYQKAFSLDPLSPSGSTYESIMIACEAIEKADSLKGEDIRRALLDNSPYEGLQADIPFDAYGDCLRPYRVVTVQDGRFVEVLP